MKKKKFPDGSIAAFLKHGYSPTQLNATERSQNTASEWSIAAFNKRGYTSSGEASFFPNVAQSQPVAAFL